MGLRSMLMLKISLVNVTKTKENMEFVANVYVLFQQHHSIMVCKHKLFYL